MHSLSPTGWVDPHSDQTDLVGSVESKGELHEGIVDVCVFVVLSAPRERVLAVKSELQ
jgi:hypothetical protein